MEKGSLNNGSDVLGRIIKYCRCALLHDLCCIKVCIFDPAKIHLYFFIVVRRLKVAYSSKLCPKTAPIVDKYVSWQSMEESVAANSLTVTESILMIKCLIFLPFPRKQVL